MVGSVEQMPNASGVQLWLKPQWCETGNVNENGIMALRTLHRIVHGSHMPQWLGKRSRRWDSSLLVTPNTQEKTLQLPPSCLA
jgi:hypothetical protein